MGCGARFAARCAGCGTDLPSEARFCFSCGAVVATGTTSAPRSPESYTPKHLAERILTSKAALEGERKQVTVLFADLKGSMELLADRDPEEARKILDPVLEHMMEAVHRYEGTVNQVMGDGIMALFGAPIAHEDHAVRACYAALRMQESIRRYSEGVRRIEGIPIRIRVGLNSGEVVVRSIGSDLHMDYTAVGQTTHLAARMEQLADPGAILLTASTLKLAEGFVLVKPLGPTPVKGLSAAIDVYEVTGLGVARTRLQAAEARGLTHFVGRDAETEQLHRALENARQGHGQVVAVLGEPGVGKSRLFYEFVRSHRVHGWLVLESGSVSYGKATAYLPVIDLLKNYFRIQDRDSQREVREKIAGKLITLDETLKSTLPALLALLDVAVDDPSWQTLDPPGRRDRTLDAVKRLLLRESQVQPLVLVFEDLHWLDSESQALLDGIVESLPSSQILLLVNYRPEYQQGWGSKTYYTQLRIDTLPVETADQLLRSLVGDDPSVQPLKAVLIARTEGNPFFLEESVRTLIEGRALVGTPGAYRFATAVHDIDVPPTVHGILAARIDRLPPDEKILLQTAAAIGKDVPVALLEGIADLSESELRRSLAHLQAAEFLYEARLFPDLEYTFKHALTHEVAYGSLLSERRRALHARIVDVVERLYPDRLAERTEQLAHHALRGELWEKALRHCRQAGAKALTRSANDVARTSFEQALAALERVPEGTAADDQRIELRFDLRSALMPLGEFERTLQVLTEAEELALKSGDRRRLGWTAGMMANLLWELGEQDRAVAAGERALTIADEFRDDGLRDLAYRYLGRCHYALGQFSRAVDALECVIELRRAAGQQQSRLSAAPILSPEIFLVSCLAETGAFREGAAYGEDAIRVAETNAQHFNLSAACAAVGRLYLRQGQIEKSIATLERGLEVCNTTNIPLLFPVTASPLGAVYALAGRLSDALPLLEDAVERAGVMRRIVDQSLYHAWLSEALVRVGRLEEAMNFALRALDLAVGYKESGNRAWILRLLGDIHAQRDAGCLEQAEGRYRDALALADELGMRPLRAHCHLSLGLLYERAGRSHEALSSLRNARELFHKMEMGFWLPQVEAALARVGAIVEAPRRT
jgi:class 3 adenylate cyclase/tetratricopeptide (TPR) repeat protein